MDDASLDPNPGPLEQQHLEALRKIVTDLQQHEGPWRVWHSELEHPPPSSFRPFDEAETVSTARNWLYTSNRIFPFDWGSWDDGREIFRTWQPDTAAGLDHLTVRKLLTAVARNDRFYEGAWVDIFERGIAVPLFARLLELEEALASSS